jgi:hypothetical protein
MFKNVLKVVMIIMIVTGIALSVSNFLPRLEAGSHAAFGTTTQIPGGSPDWWTWLYDDYFCISPPSNCCIVFPI